MDLLSKQIPHLFHPWVYCLFLPYPSNETNKKFEDDKKQLDSLMFIEFLKKISSFLVLDKEEKIKIFNRVEKFALKNLKKQFEEKIPTTSRKGNEFKIKRVELVSLQDSEIFFKHYYPGSVNGDNTMQVLMGKCEENVSDIYIASNCMDFVTRWRGDKIHAIIEKYFSYEINDIGRVISVFHGYDAQFNYNKKKKTANWGIAEKEKFVGSLFECIFLFNKKNENEMEREDMTKNYKDFMIPINDWKKFLDLKDEVSEEKEEKPILSLLDAIYSNESKKQFYKELSAFVFQRFYKYSNKWGKNCSYIEIWCSNKNFKGKINGLGSVILYEALMNAYFKDKKNVVLSFVDLTHLKEIDRYPIKNLNTFKVYKNHGFNQIGIVKEIEEYVKDKPEMKEKKYKENQKWEKPVFWKNKNKNFNNQVRKDPPGIYMVLGLKTDIELYFTVLKNMLKYLDLKQVFKPKK